MLVNKTKRQRRRALEHQVALYVGINLEMIDTDRQGAVTSAIFTFPLLSLTWLLVYAPQLVYRIFFKEAPLQQYGSPRPKSRQSFFCILGRLVVFVRQIVSILDAGSKLFAVGWNTAMFACLGL